ncbi:MAG: hypothetical protein SYC29_04605 [Planctomycetota bacterium]|nr:hypothetical protein [Planctomycetota bacterium]
MRSNRIMLGLALAAMSLPFVFAALAAADDPVTWGFDETTEGEDVYWTSPTPVRPDAAEYQGEYELTGVWVKIIVFIPIWVEVTDQIPPEYLSGSDTIAGPAPIVLFDEHVVYPEPPEEPGIEAKLKIGLDANGYGYLEATDIVLGTLDLGEYGEVDLEGLRIAGTITVTAVGTYRPADINGDGVVNTADLLLLLADWGCTGTCEGDVDGDGDTDTNDLLLLLADWG